MAAKTRNISTLIESQLPGFIIEDYGMMKTFIESYYEQQELRGQPLDIISNITQYRNIDFYSKNILKEKTTLSSAVLASDTTITVNDATSFPDRNGYIRINDEILFYKERTDTQFLEVSRGVSGNNTLGDLYNKSEFVSTEASPHSTGEDVLNISNLFLYAFVRNFEVEYLESFPEKFLKGEVDKRTLIKNIGDFYRAKGTDRSIQFLFKTIVSSNPEEKVSVYNPKDNTYKASTSDWISTYTLKINVLSGDPKKLVGERIEQGFNSAVVDNVVGTDIILAPETIIGEFSVANRTRLEKEDLLASYGNGYKISVFSTQGFDPQGTLYIGNTQLEYRSKNVNQFTLFSRDQTNTNYPVGTSIFSGDLVTSTTSDGSTVTFLVSGVVYNLVPRNPQPYASTGDQIQVSRDGFDTFSPVIKTPENNIRWLLNSDFTEPNSIHPNITLDSVVADISAVFEDEQYYYICTSSFPSNSDLLTIDVNVPLEDQELLKLIRKQPITTTEVYSTGNKDVGILVDGSPVYGIRSEEEVVYGNIESFQVLNKGRNYALPPTVLINEEPNKARAVLSGETLSSVEIRVPEIYEEDPEVRITSGEGARLSAIVTDGVITSIRVDEPGRYYTSPPTIVITDVTGRGGFAEYQANVSNGQITEVIKINGGKLYDPRLTSVVAVPVGTGAVVKAKVRRWIKDRYKLLETVLDTNNGYTFKSRSGKVGYGYGVVANPVILRRRLLDSINAVYEETFPFEHSPILGYAYDGNPIYGPYGYSNPLNPASSIERLKSGYQLKTTRVNGPSTITNPIGTFVDDYEWKPSVDSEKTELDANNGRFCVTPDYPQGVYAYFLTIDANNDPVFPYVVGSNFYSLPVDSNYNTPITQKDLPRDIKRLKSPGFLSSGTELKARVKTVTSGSVTSASVISSSDTFEVGSTLLVQNNSVDAFVSSLKGKTVVGIESEQTKAVEITTKETVYLFAGDTVVQGNGSFGEIVTDAFNTNNFVLRQVIKDINASPEDPIFNDQDLLNASIVVQRFILDESSTYTLGTTVQLVDGDLQQVVAEGTVLESTSAQNSVIVRVSSGTFEVGDQYFLRSNTLSDTSRSTLISIIDLSKNIELFSANENIAIVETNENHDMSVGDFVEVDITPNDFVTETTYFVRKKIYQETTARTLEHKSLITDTGIGSGDVIGTGLSYVSGTYNDVELVFRDQTQARPGVGLPGDPGNARATIVVGNPDGVGFGPVSQVLITSKGSGYRKEDILTIIQGDPIPDVTPSNTQKFAFTVDHVGFAAENRQLFLSNLNNLSNGDRLKIGDEIVEIEGVNLANKFVTVNRAQQGTSAVNHYEGNIVVGEYIPYRLSAGYYPFDNNALQPVINTYNEETREINVSYSYGDDINFINELSDSSVFFDQSVPRKVVSLTNTQPAANKLELSKDNEDNFVVNPSLDIVRFYSYKFDTSHFSMTDTFLDISPSINYNILVDGKEISSVAPGSPGSFVSVKFGFTPDIFGTTQEKVDVRYSTFYYFIKASGVDTEQARLSIIPDPLTGRKRITHITDTKFVYDLDNPVEYDGSGIIEYTTTSNSTTGVIEGISIRNSQTSLESVPIVFGVFPATKNKAVLEPVVSNGKIVEVKVLSGGSSYSKPNLVLSGPGTGAELGLVVVNGVISGVRVSKQGSGYTEDTTASVVETDNTIYLESTNIGIPRDVEITYNGFGFTNDYSTTPIFKSKTVLVLEDADLFTPGNVVTQPSTNATANVDTSFWKKGSNLLKLFNLEGEFEAGQNVVGLGGSSATVKHVLTTDFDEDIRSYSQNGYFASNKGKINDSNNRIQDSFFYQDYSYVVESETPIETWRDLILETTHPAGFQLFGEVNLFSVGETPMPAPSQKPIETYQQLGVTIQAVDTINTSRVITQQVATFQDFNVIRGSGAISVSDVDLSQTNFQDIRLVPEFDGTIDPDTGKRIGTTTFTMFEKDSNLILDVFNEQQIFVTLDGIVQEPGEAYIVVGNQIEFATAPLGERVAEGQIVEAQKFYGKHLKYIDDALNTQYLRKFQDISDQFDNITSDFDLYYDDGSIAKTEDNELLIVVVDGVKQRYGKSYIITRYEDPSTPDKIVFLERPEIEDPLYDSEDPREDRVLRLGQKCYIYSIGNYFSGTIETDNVKAKPRGPFPIVNSIDGTVVSVPDPDYALVFVNNVLQIPRKSYNITGPLITFRQDIPFVEQEDGTIVANSVEIIYVYGKTTDQVYTIHNFETDTYKRDFEVNITGTVYGDEALNWYYDTELYPEYISALYTADRADVDQRITYLKSAEYVLVDGGTDFTVDREYGNIPFYNIPTQSFVVGQDGSGDLLIDTVLMPTLDLVPGNTYRFNVSNPTMFDQTLVFLHTGGSEFIRQENIGTPGEPDAFVDLIIFPEAPTGSGVIEYSNSANGISTGLINLDVGPEGSYAYDVRADYIKILDFGQVEFKFGRLNIGERVQDGQQLSTVGFSGYDGNGTSPIIIQANFEYKQYDAAVPDTEVPLGRIKDFKQGIDGSVSFRITANIQYYDDVLENKVLLIKKEGRIDTKTYVIRGLDYTNTLVEETSNDGLTSVSRFVTNWLGGTNDDECYYERTKLFENLHPQDKIRISGENKFREVLEIDRKGFTTQQNVGKSVTKDHFVKLRTSAYNGPQNGQGLGIFANIDSEGRVTELLWNQPEWNEEYTRRTAYAKGYLDAPELYFIPQTPAGGGARASVTWFGGIVSVNLLEPGYGYEVPPQVVVAKRYEVYKNPNRYINTVSLARFNDLKIQPSLTKIDSIFVLNEGSQALIEATIVDVSAPEFQDISDQITIIIPIESDVSIVEVDLQINAGIVDFDPTEVFFNALSKEELVIKTITQTVNFAVLDDPFIQRSEITLFYQQIVTDKFFLNPVPVDSNQVARLDADFLIGDTILYVNSASHFPDEGQLVIDYERVIYDRRTEDRFFIVDRGVADPAVSGVASTAEADHFAGSFARLEPALLNVRDADIETFIQPPELFDGFSASAFGDVSMPDIEENFTPISKQVQNQYEADDLALRSLDSVVTVEIVDDFDSVIFLGIEDIQVEFQSGGIIVVPGAIVPVQTIAVFENEIVGQFDLPQNSFYPEGSLAASYNQGIVATLQLPIESQNLSISQTQITEFLQVTAFVDSPLSAQISFEFELFKFYPLEIETPPVDVKNVESFITSIINPFEKVLINGILTELIGPEVVEIDDAVVSQLQIVREFEDTSVVDINLSSEYITKSESALSLSDMKEVESFVKLIINPVEKVLINGIVTELIGPEVVEIDDAVVSQLQVVTPDTSIVDIALGSTSVTGINLDDEVRMLDVIFSYDKIKPVEITVTATFDPLAVVHNDTRIFQIQHFQTDLSAEFFYDKILPVDYEVEFDSVGVVDSFITLTINPFEKVLINGIVTELIGPEIVEIDDAVVSQLQIVSPAVDPSTVTFERTYEVPLWSGGAEYRGQNAIGENGQILTLDTPFVGDNINLVHNDERIFQFQFSETIKSVVAEILLGGSKINGQELFVAFDPETPVTSFLNGSDVRAYGDGTPVEANDVPKFVRLWSGGAQERSGEFPRDISGDELFLATPFQGDELGVVQNNERIFQIEHDQTSLSIEKQIERDYPNSHLDSLGEPNGQGFYAEYNMPTAAFPFEVFFTETVPGADPEDPDQQLIIPREVLIEDISLQIFIDKTIEITPFTEFGIKTEIVRTIGEPTEGGALYGDVGMLSIVTNLDSIPDDPNENPPVFVSFIEVVAFEPQDISTNIVRNIIRTAQVDVNVFQEIVRPFGAGALAPVDIRPTEDLALVSSDTKVEIDVISDLASAAVVEGETQETKLEISTGIADYLNEGDLASGGYLQTTLGGNFAQYERNAFLSNGSLNINANLFETLGFYEIQEFERGESSIRPNGSTFNLGFPSINEIGGTLGVDLLNTETIAVTINSTVNLTDLDWPTSGRILIGDTSDPDPANHIIEEIEYTGLSGTTLIGITRGVNGTTVQTHASATSYVRTIG